MPMYDYVCNECKKPFRLMRLIAKRDEGCKCEHCGAEAVHVRPPTAASFSFAEGERAESSKPDSYWENAEREKQRKIKKERDEITEKSFYKDKDCPAKYKDVANVLK